MTHDAEIRLSQHGSLEILTCVVATKFLTSRRYLPLLSLQIVYLGSFGNTTIVSKSLNHWLYNICLPLHTRGEAAVLDAVVLDAVANPPCPFWLTARGPGPGPIKLFSFCMVRFSTLARCQIPAW
jgi:hypothetical protein